MTDTDMLYMATLEKRNAELEAHIAELEDKHWNECRQIAHYSDELNEVNSYTEIVEDMATKQTISGMNKSNELKEAKRLLKLAVEDFKVIGKVLDADCDILINCEECPLHRAGINCRCWNHQDEALALIGGEQNG